MWNILSKVLIVVIVILAFPTGLILASQNSSPGDNTYPIKRKMEDMLSSIFSLNPITKAYFKTDLSNRRFKESIVLLKRNSADKTATNTSLVEMLSTTAVASADIQKVTDPALKKRLSDDLSKQITTYRQDLLKVAKEKNQVTPTPIPTEKPVPTVSPVQPTPTRVPGQPTPTPTQVQVSVTPIPSPTPIIITCNDVIKNYSQCGGTTGYEKYPKTHLLMIAERTNSCTKITKKEVTDDWDLKIDCDPNIIGQCSSDNIQACIDMLAKLQQTVNNPNASDGGNKPQQSDGGGNKPQGMQFTATPTSTPTPTLRKSAFETLQQQAADSGATSSATESGIQISTSGGGLVQGIATSIREINLKNLFNSIISIFK